MSPATLRAICIKSTYHSLMLGEWENSQDNPFSHMPPSVVQELLSCMLPPDRVTGDRIVSSHLLLTSGRLQNVELFHARDSEGYFMLFRMLSRGCQNVRSLSLPRCYPGLVVISGSEEERILRELFQNCSNLEELHSRILFDPHYLRNCSKLARLKLHLDRTEAAKFFHHLSPDLLQRLGCIRVFSLCEHFIPSSASKNDNHSSLAAMLLNNCPQLTSLGFLDSSMALKRLHDRDRRSLPRQFQLRRCYWGYVRYLGLFLFSDMIRVAVLSCPLAEVLVMNVRAAGCLKHLKTLSNLTSLDINFKNCEDYYEREFCSLLNEVGPQLRSLSISESRSKLHNLCLISDSCPNLSSLQLRSRVIVEPSQPRANFHRLKRLSVYGCDRECLFSLLWNCALLKVVCLDNCEALEDGVLHEILLKNSFAELEVAHFHKSSLSKSGLTRFVQSAGNLKKFSVGSPDLPYLTDVMRHVKDLNPSVAFGSSLDYSELEEEEFPRKCWL